MKWRYYAVAQLPRLPQHFAERIQEALTLEELARRRATFMARWREMQPLAEREVGPSFCEMLELL